MRVPFSEVFRIEQTEDGIALAETRPVVMNPFCSMRLQAEIDRVANPDKLAKRYLEVAECDDGRWEVEGFAAAEAR